MKKYIYSFLSIVLLTACSSKPMIEPTPNEKSETHDPTSTEIPLPLETDQTTSEKANTSDNIDIFSRQASEFICPNNEYFGVADESIGLGLILKFDNEGMFTVSYDSAGGDYYYGKVNKIEDNMYSFYGEILSSLSLEHCEGEGCFIMPNLTDETIDGYLKIEGDLMYYIPYQMSINDLRAYSSDRGCKFFKN